MSHEPDHRDDDPRRRCPVARPLALGGAQCVRDVGHGGSCRFPEPPADAPPREPRGDRPCCDKCGVYKDQSRADRACVHGEHRWISGSARPPLPAAADRTPPHAPGGDATKLRRVLRRQARALERCAVALEALVAQAAVATWQKK